MTRFEAVCEALADLEPGPFSARTLFEKVKTKGSWADGGIWIEEEIALVAISSLSSTR